MRIMFIKLILPLFACLALLTAIDARRVRIRPRPAPQQESEDLPESELQSEEDSRAQPAIQYYDTEPRENLQDGRVVLVSSDDDYNGLYGQPTPRARSDYNRQPVQSFSRSTTLGPRTKDHATKAPPVQTIRNYSKVNDDGSFTFGYEAADGSFKEETRGTDCVVRGKYGYIDPDGNKREFTYVSGNPCDPNNPDGQESGEDRERDTSEEDSSEPENVPQNYPKQRPVRPLPVRPIHTTTAAPTTVFQNNYAQHALQAESEDEQPEPIQVLQQHQRHRIATTVQPLEHKLPTEVTIRQRPRITVQTTPSPVTLYHQSPQPVSITPRPQTYRAPVQALPTQPPATTYRPTYKATQQPAAISYNKPTPRPSIYSTPIQNTIQSTTRRPIDFAEEFQKFQNEHNIPLTTSTLRTTTPLRQYTRPQQQQRVELPATSNPIYESQLVYDPSSGQYDSALYQQLPQTDGDFSLNHRIQPYVHQLSSPAPPQLVTLEQLQQQANPIYSRGRPAQLAQFSQQVYEKDRENLQVLNSQQLYEQQQQLQQQQLQQDRIDAARKAAAQQQQQPHRFQTQQQLVRPTPADPSQGFYYIQPSGSGGQIDAFLRGHNIDF